MEIKLNLKIRDTEIKDLSLDEIRELRDILNKLITKEREYVPYYPYCPVHIPTVWEPWEITCDESTTTISPDTGDDIYYTVSLK
jgi:hypothetical protein